MRTKRHTRRPAASAGPWFALGAAFFGVGVIAAASIVARPVEVARETPRPAPVAARPDAVEAPRPAPAPAPRARDVVPAASRAKIQAEVIVREAEAVERDGEDRRAVEMLESAVWRAGDRESRTILVAARDAMLSRQRIQLESARGRVEDACRSGEYAQARTIVEGLRSSLPRSFRGELDNLDAQIERSRGAELASYGVR